MLSFTGPLVGVYELAHLVAQMRADKGPGLSFFLKILFFIKTPLNKLN